ncbi:MAG: hypothetical protein V9E89_03525 [Ilumatobacteraceae bacterium]
MKSEERPLDASHGTRRTFALDEYSSAAVAFFSDAVHAVARADGILAEIEVESVEALPLSQNTLPSGEVLPMAPAEVSALITLTISEGIDGRFDDYHLAIASAANDYSSQVVPHMFDHISRLCDATGNVVDGAGKSIWEAQLEMLETIAISFNEDGEPSLPQLFMHPDTAAKMGQPPEDFQARFDSILIRRRDEWLARRRTRRLPRHRE